MQSRDRSLLLNAAPILLAIAIFGYLAGHGHSAVAPMERTREVSSTIGSLEYAPASGWRPASEAPRLPGLSIAQPLVLAPNGNAARAGLIAGQLLDSPLSPLPPQFLARLRRLPNTEVVELQSAQAYKYSQLSVTGSDQRLTLYTVPGSTTSKTAIVCYSTVGSSTLSSSYMRACERIAATLTAATGEAQVLAPDVDYARQVGAAVGRVDALRVALRTTMRLETTAGDIWGLAMHLADGLARAAESLAAVQPPPAVGWARATLLESLSQARDAYAALAAAISSGSPSSYAAAGTRVYEAEGGLSTALKNFALLGYK